MIARQGDAILEAPELDVLYEGRANVTGAPAPAKAGEAKEDGKVTTGSKPGEQDSKLKTIKARGGVVMTNKDDRATAETLDYDAAAERVVLGATW